MLRVQPRQFLNSLIKMHLYFIPRGIRQQIEIFEKFIQTQMFTWERTNLITNEKEISMVQGAYRDAGPFKEYVFPEECLFEVLEMLGINPKKDYAISGLKMSLLRKIVGAKKIPRNLKQPKNISFMGLIKEDSDGKVKVSPYRYIERQGVSIHAIGIKKDDFRDFDFGDNKKYYQEAL